MLNQLQGLGELRVLPQSMLGALVSLPGLLSMHAGMVLWGHLLIVCPPVWYFGASFLCLFSSNGWVVGIPMQVGHHLLLC